MSSYELLEQERSLLSKGLNFGLKRKINPVNNKIEMEKLFYCINEKERLGKVTVTDSEHLKVRLKHFSIRRSTEGHSGINLTRDDHKALKSLKNNSSIVIQRPDKGGGTVIMNSTDYNEKLAALIGDANKFQVCSPKQSDVVKAKLNQIANKYKSDCPQLFKMLRVLGKCTKIFGILLYAPLSV